MPFGCWFFEARFTQALANRATALFCTGGHAKLAAGRFRLFAGVPVAIRQESAMIAPNQALRQLQLGLHRAAHKIKRLVESATNHRGAIGAGLLSKLPPERKQAAVHNRAGKAANARHAAHVQILNADAAKAFPSLGRVNK